MSGERVDLDDLRTLAVAAQESADYREDMQRKRMARWILSPRRDGTVDVVIAQDGADVFDRALLVDAAFAVAAQPAVVLALVDRIRDLETFISGLARSSLRSDKAFRSDWPELFRPSDGGALYLDEARERLLERGAVFP